MYELNRFDLLFNQLMQDVSNAIFIISERHLISHLFNVSARIAHGKAFPRDLQHRKIIEAVSDGSCFLKGNAELA